MPQEAKQSKRKVLVSITWERSTNKHIIELSYTCNKFYTRREMQQSLNLNLFFAHIECGWGNWKLNSSHWTSILQEDWNWKLLNVELKLQLKLWLKLMRIFRKFASAWKTHKLHPPSSTFSQVKLLCCVHRKGCRRLERINSREECEL